MDFVAAFNGLEAIWWATMAIVCWWKARGKWQSVCRTAAVCFVLFAATDVIETQTGAWWKPWWLAVAKGICLIGLLGCGAWAWRIRQHTMATNRNSSERTDR